MIHYDLRCGDGHAFDGWFRDSSGFDEQAARGLVTCPACGSDRVERALMTPGLARKGAKPSVPAAPAAELPSASTPPASPQAMPSGMPDGLRAKLMAIRAEVEKRCVYVGPAFAEEARAIHDGTAEPRPIYGEATPEEAEALRDDGVPVASIPWVRGDA